ISTKPNIKARYPFKEDGIAKRDVIRILEEHGLGLPAYYRWRTRSGCYFCFFQRKVEWVGLKENHPNLFELAKRYEKINPEADERYTWAQGESLSELEQAARIEEIKRNHLKAQETSREGLANRSLYEVFTDDDDDDDDERACLICDL